jgi:hypothetical protein
VGFSKNAMNFIVLPIDSKRGLYRYTIRHLLFVDDGILSFMNVRINAMGNNNSLNWFQQYGTNIIESEIPISVPILG